MPVIQNPSIGVLKIRPEYAALALVAWLNQRTCTPGDGHRGDTAALSTKADEQPQVADTKDGKRSKTPKALELIPPSTEHLEQAQREMEREKEREDELMTILGTL